MSVARIASARCDERLVDSRCEQDVGASYLHRHEDGTLVASKASSRQAIQDYKKKERERQQQQKQSGKPGTQPKPGMAEGWQLKSLKELTESDAPAPSLLPPPPHQPAALSQELPAPQVSAAKDASAASQSQRNVPAANASKRTAQNLSQTKLSTDAPAQSELSTKAGSSAAPAPTAADATAGTHGPPSPSSLPSAHMLQGVSVTPTVSTAQAKAAPAASVRLNATGKHASEVSGVYQKTGERVNGYPLYKKVDGP